MEFRKRFIQGGLQMIGVIHWTPEMRESRRLNEEMLRKGKAKREALTPAEQQAKTTEKDLTSADDEWNLAMLGTIARANMRALGYDV